MRTMSLSEFMYRTHYAMESAEIIDFDGEFFGRYLDEDVRKKYGRCMVLDVKREHGLRQVVILSTCKLGV